MSAAPATLQQRRAPAVREASTSSIEEDRKISGSLHQSASPSHSPSSIASSLPATANNLSRPPLSLNTGRTPSDPSSKDKNAKRGHIQKHEKIQRIGLLRGSSYVKSTDKDSVPQHELTTSIGLQDDAVYDAYLPRPIAFLRRYIVAVLRKEAPLHERHQQFIRRPWLDRYFVNTSLLGTHSFFLVFLPMIFWLGDPRFGRGLINVLAFGVYLSPNPIEMRRALGGAGASKRKIQFTIGGSTDDASEDTLAERGAQDLPIPLTQSKAHPNFVAPDEQVARNLAADIKHTSPADVEKEVKHYDADGKYICPKQA
ncbi:hypothetical protein NDA16_003547 [Ustilago loliicola]|nr:hypothetical protein NDA16_003547 [Ustilago loliicola]